VNKIMFAVHRCLVVDRGSLPGFVWISMTHSWFQKD